MPSNVETYFDNALARFNPEFDKKELPELNIPKDPQISYSGLSNAHLTPIGKIGDLDDYGDVFFNGEKLSDKDGRLLDGSIREIGIEVLAFYKSKRFLQNSPFPGHWGIFYIRQGIEHIYELLRREHPKYAKLILAYQFLRRHEMFHFKFDVYALSLESAIGKPLYGPLKYIYRNHRSHQIEEALANRSSWIWAKKTTASTFFYDFMKLQPRCYSEFDNDRSQMGSRLAANLLDHNISLSARRDEQAYWVGQMPLNFTYATCPEYIVEPLSLSNYIDRALIFPTVRRINDSADVTEKIKRKYRNIRNQWEKTKSKLVAHPEAPGLNFKPWDDGLWSVRVNKNFRAHLRRNTKIRGFWDTIDIGPHAKMGHG